MSIAKAKALRDLADAHGGVFQQQLGLRQLAAKQIFVGRDAIFGLEQADQV